jgi:hypothetical protein
VTFGVSDEALVKPRQVTQLQEAYAATALAGMMGWMADQITNERLDFDHLLRIALRRAVLYGAAGRLDEAFDCPTKPLHSATRPSCNSPSDRSGTACAAIRGLASASGRWGSNGRISVSGE